MAIVPIPAMTAASSVRQLQNSTGANTAFETTPKSIPVANISIHSSQAGRGGVNHLINICSSLNSDFLSRTLYCSSKIMQVSTIAILNGKFSKTHFVLDHKNIKIAKFGTRHIILKDCPKVSHFPKSWSESRLVLLHPTFAKATARKQGFGESARGRDDIKYTPPRGSIFLTFQNSQNPLQYSKLAASRAEWSAKVSLLSYVGEPPNVHREAIRACLAADRKLLQV